MLLMIQVAVIVDIKDPFKGDNENEADRIISIYEKKKKTWLNVLLVCGEVTIQVCSTNVHAF